MSSPSSHPDIQWQGPDRPLPGWLADPQTDNERAFAAFVAANPHVYRELEERALRLHRAGRRRIGVKAIIEAMRYDWAVRTDAPDYKLNNSHTAFLARLLLHNRPELEGVIETRRAQADSHKEAA